VVIIEKQPGEPWIKSARNISDAIETCVNARARALLLYPENLPEKFFDLSSGEAGEILQKLRQYRIRFAIVCPKAMPLTDRFRELMIEENRANHFRLFESADAAREWLLLEQEVADE